MKLDQNSLEKKNKECEKKKRKLMSWFYPELLDQVHVGPLVLLHAALRDAGHVGSQRAVDEHTQHV